MGVREILAGSRIGVKFLFLLVNDVGNAEQTLSCGAGASFWECILYPLDGMRSTCLCGSLDYASTKLERLLLLNVNATTDPYMGVIESDPTTIFNKSRTSVEFWCFGK